MNQFEKNQANREVRRGSRKEIAKWDAEAKKGKKGGQKNCPGWLDHTRQKKKELIVPCNTCKRKFCSEECHLLHKELCEAKFYYNDTGDNGPLLELCKKIYNTYYDEKGCVKQVWVEKYDLRNNGCSQHGHWSIQWKHGELAEANRILKKQEPEFLREARLKNLF